MTDKPPTCQHDWRIDPNVVLLSNPPSQRLVCAICLAVTSRRVPGATYVGPSLRVEDWRSA